LAQALADYLPGWGWPGSAEEFIRAWLAADHVIDARLLQEIQQLRRRGVVCCLATSQERNRAEYMKTVMGFAEAFDHLFFSCELGCQKPQAAFYQAVQDRLTADREAVLFWDDNAANVEGARRFGWQARVYTGFEPFCQAMDILIFQAKGEP
ncbi:MAG: HAD-IA family hydrolase, partial [Anaerolineaceae bacterium]